jgi:hypothetical protein
VAFGHRSLSGLDQIRAPSKTQAFLGRSNFAHAPALSAIALNILVCYALWHKKRSPHPNQRRHIVSSMSLSGFPAFNRTFSAPRRPSWPARISNHLFFLLRFTAN